MNDVVPLLFGLSVTLLLGLGVGVLLDGIEGRVLQKWGGQIPAPRGYPAKEWADLVLRASPGGSVLGTLERIIFFASFWVPGGWPLVGGRLVFKVACKWKSWELGEMPKRPAEPASVDEWLADARARLYRTESAHRRFTIGVAASIVLALGGVAAGRGLEMLLLACR